MDDFIFHSSKKIRCVKYFPSSTSTPVLQTKMLLSSSETVKINVWLTDWLYEVQHSDNLSVNFWMGALLMDEGNMASALSATGGTACAVWNCCLTARRFWPEPSCVDSACSPRACVGSPRVLQLLGSPYLSVWTWLRVFVPLCLYELAACAGCIPTSRLLHL